MKIENSKDPNVSNITIAHVDFNFDFINVLKANGMTKYSSSGFGESAVKGISIGDARWWTSNAKGRLVVLDNGSATLTMEGQP